MTILHEANGWRLRVAQPSDNARLCDIFKSIDMESDLRLAEERDPSFFALLEMHLDKQLSVVLEDTTAAMSESERVVGCCTAIMRNAWIDGELHKVAYLSDLRIIPTWRKARVFPVTVKIFTQYLAQHEGVKVAYCAMIRSNKRAQGARIMAKGHLMTPYKMTSIQFVGGGKSPKLAVQRAEENNIDELVEFLAKQNKTRMLGYDFTKEVLLQRIASWPGMQLSDFYLVRDKNKRIVACAAPWNTENSVRRTRVLGYQGPMVALRKLYNAEAFLRGFIPLPKEGDCFHFVSLTHFEIEEENPAYCADLLRAIYADYRHKKLHFMSALVPEGSPLEKAFDGFRTREIEMDLFTMSISDQFRDKDFFTLRPGFEMVLH